MGNRLSFKLILMFFPLFFFAQELSLAEENQEDASRSPAAFKPDPIFQQIEKKTKPTEKSAPGTPDTSQNSDKAPATGEDGYGLTGDWGGKRKALEEAGLGISIIYKGDWLRNFSGGSEKKSIYCDNLDLKFLLDAEKAFGAKGLSIFVYGLGNSGANRGTLATASGTNQGLDNIETTVDDFHLFEAWAQYLSEDHHFSVLFGLHDLNSEFYVTDSSTLFFNPSFGVGTELAQTGVKGPSIFPYSAPTLRFRFEPSKQIYAETAVFNATSSNPDVSTGTYFPMTGKNGYLLISEVGMIGTESNPYKLALGFWSYSKPDDSLSETVVDAQGNTVPKAVGNAGAYFLADRTFTPGVSGFFRFGIATSESNPVRENISGGLVFKGILPKRPDDQLGVGVTLVSPGAEYQTSTASAGASSNLTEEILELVYRFEALRGVALIPDLQYSRHPGMNGSLPNSFAGGMRVELSL